MSDTPTIPATALGGALLALGRVLPACTRHWVPPRFCVVLSSGPYTHGILCRVATDGDDEIEDVDADLVSFTLSSPQVREALGVVAAAGERCAKCRGSGVTADPEGQSNDCGCRDGYTRAPEDIRHILDGPLGTLVVPDGFNAAEVSAIALGEWVRRREAGDMRPVVLFGGWEPDDVFEGLSLLRCLDPRTPHVAKVWARGAQGWAAIGQTGPETGDAGKAAAEVALIAAGALLLRDGRVVGAGGAR